MTWLLGCTLRSNLKSTNKWQFIRMAESIVQVRSTFISYIELNDLAVRLYLAEQLKVNQHIPLHCIAMSLMTFIFKYTKGVARVIYCEAAPHIWMLFQI